jgi:death on curing protein
VNTTPDNCFYLTPEIVIEVHGHAIEAFGGSPGLRDRALLESAVAAPQATYDGTSVYTDMIDVAAAYLFYLCRNHPFVDGNKRAALGSCLLFLRLNFHAPAPDGIEWEQLTLDVAASKLNRDQTTTRLRALVRPGS